MGLGLAWAIGISALIGLALTPQLSTIVRSVSARSFALGPVLDPIALLDALLAFSYLAFFVAFVDAHYRVAVGLDPDEAAAAPARKPGAGAGGRPASGQ